MPKNESSPFSARKRLIVVAISACFTSAPAWANPTGPQVVNGNASIAQAGKLLTVTNTNGAIINWNTFSIAADEATRFNQTSAASSVLNRVLANDPSVLLGALSSNGRVWLVNPAGILVGQGARIDVAGFIASTLNVRNEDFLAGRLSFQATPNAGKVENYGQITTPSGGSVYLVAPNVENHGTISAPDGEVILVAGQRVELLDTGTPGVKVEVVGAEGNATNLGSIVSEAGRIGIAGVLVKNSGTLNASSVVREGGRIFLKASKDAYVDGAGRIVATGAKGGSIEVLGNRVAVMDQAQLDASGSAGGGTVLVGGDLQGKNPQVQNAQVTYFGPEASIKADAGQSGDGGKVIVWADDTTRALGTISAKGGAQSGNGGFVETSGHHLETAGIRVDASAPQGKAGSWLLDPNDVQIVDGPGTDVNVTYGSGIWDTSADSAVVYGENIALALNDGTSVVIQTGTSSPDTQYGDIAMSGVTLGVTPANDTSLTLKAHRNIAITNSSVSSTNKKLGVTLNAHYANDTAPGNVQITDSSIDTNGGNLVIGGGLDPTATPAIGHSDGLSSTFVDGVLIQGAQISAGGGHIAISGQGSNYPGYSGRGVYINGGASVGTTGMGTVTVTGIGGGGYSAVKIGSVDSPVTIVSTEMGTLTLDGSGNGIDGGRGVHVSNGSLVQTTSGTLHIKGQGGTDYSGVKIDGYGTSVTTGDGGYIHIEGTGGAGSYGYSHGIYVTDGASIAASGTGKITLNGNGGAGSGGYSDGVRLGGYASISSVDGGISIIGRGFGGGYENYGLYIHYGATVSATGTGTINLEGTGSAAGSASNTGIRISSSGTGYVPGYGYRFTTVSSAGGAISMTGLAGAGGNGIEIVNGAVVQANGSYSHPNGGAISLVTNDNIIIEGANISASGYGGAAARVDGGNILIQSRYGSIDINSTNIGASGAGNGGYGGKIEITLGNFLGENPGTPVLDTGGTAPYGGSIVIGYSGPVNISAIGAGNSQYGGTGGLGGDIRISTALASTGGGITITYYRGSIAANGGQGGNAGYGGGVGGTGG